jgi:hypothetical protein
MYIICFVGCLGEIIQSFAWQIFIWVKRDASVDPGRKFISVLKKSTNFVHGAEPVLRS